jgi:competence protein CoiA
MLSARRKSDGETVLAYFERKSNGPFACLDCAEEMILKVGRRKISYFAHANPLARHRAENESDTHRRCKMELYEALKREPGVRDLALERRFDGFRPDIFAAIKDIPVAIEVQISSLSLETILDRTIRYHQKGIYVLWLLQWTPKLESERYTPTIWERWIHAASFGRVYYWLEGLRVVGYHFDAALKSIPQRSWYAPSGKRLTGGGYTSRLKRVRVPVRGRSLNLVNDFGPRERLWWEGGGLRIPDAKLFSEVKKDYEE